ncbi:MAG: hypothetical protein O7G85_02230, partial [Planctomycetota bacterium]|nr:hypothetical protein [Planctomycetota bacterium]
NQFGKIKMMRSAFNTTPTVEYDKKTWGNIAKKINDLAFASGNKSIEEFISTSDLVKVKLEAYAKKKDDKVKLELRNTLVSHTQSIESFKKEISAAKELSKATADMKKVKGDLDKRGKTLMAHMTTLQQGHDKLLKQLVDSAKDAQDAINFIDKGVFVKLVTMNSKFTNASKLMKNHSKENKKLAKKIGEDAKKNVKKKS